jgi:ssDNA-binding replication factor A large subunit
MHRPTSIADLAINASEQYILARVTTKTEIKPCGKGWRLGAVLTDRTGSVPVTFWDDAALQADNLLVEDKVYEFTRGDIRLAGQFMTPNRPYWINFRSTAFTARELPDEEVTIPRIEKLLIRNFADLANAGHLSRVVVTGRIAQVATVRTVRGSRGADQRVRAVTMTDNAGTTVSVSLWNDQTALVDDSIVGKTVRLHELSVKSQSELGSSTFTVLRPTT